MLEKGEKLQHVFLSYSHQDEEQAQKLVARLRAQGIEVWYAPSRINYGDQIPQEIEDGLRKCQIAVIALSPASVASFWVRQEWQARLTQMSEDKSFKLISLHLADCEIPLLLRNFRYVDFRNVDFNDMRSFELRLQELLNAIHAYIPTPGLNVVGIPLVVIAMKKPEVEDLILGKNLTREQRLRFTQFTKTLQEQWPQDFVARYTDTRESWRPFFNDNRTIRDIINGLLAWVNRDNPIKQNVEVRAQFYSDDFLSPDIILRGDTWDYLGRVGCVLVLDAISIFHPAIEDYLLGSQLGANNRISIVGISPVSPNSIKANQMIEHIMINRLQRIFDRYNSYLDPQCVFEVGDGRSLSRWLYTMLPKAVETAEIANPVMRRRFQSIVPSTGSNVSPLIFREGASK